MKVNERNIGDGRELMRLIPKEAAAAVVFDPQYSGVLDKLAYGNEGCRQTGRASLPQMTEPIIKEFLTMAEGILRPSGYLFLWVDKFHLVEGIRHWLPASLSTVDLIVWDKQRIGMGYRTRRRSEYCVIAQKLPLRARATWTRHDIPDTWQEKVDRNRHPHAKPLGLLTALIEATTVAGDTIVDPDAGSFTTLEACNALGGRLCWSADIMPPPTS